MASRFILFQQELALPQLLNVAPVFPGVTRNTRVRDGDRYRHDDKSNQHHRAHRWVAQVPPEAALEGIVIGRGGDPGKTGVPNAKFVGFSFGIRRRRKTRKFAQM